MNKLLFILTVILAVSCDDGEIIVENLEFTNVNVQACETRASGTAFSYVFYKLDRTNNESLSLTLTIPIDLFIEDNSYGPYVLNSSNIVEYRKFNGQPAATYFCNDIPSATPTITEFYVSRGGEVILQTAAEMQDDNDGIPAAIEILLGDSDSDGIPDYMDIDDDGDNVLTVNEGVRIVNGAVSQTLSLDTDGDGILDYLDPDDDGDGIPTIQEDLDRDLDPTNDIQVMGGLASYLDANSATAASPAVTLYRPHPIQRSARVTITINDMTLSATNKEIREVIYDFGTYISPVEQIIRLPTF